MSFSVKFALATLAAALVASSGSATPVPEKETIDLVFDGSGAPFY